MASDVFNTEAERFLLAAILRNPTQYFEINKFNLQAEDFSVAAHKAIFGSILSAVEDKSDPSVPYVTESLRRDNRDKVVEVVNQLVTVPCSVPQAVDYARIVKGLAVSRGLQDAGVRIIDLASENRTDYSATIVEAENILRSVSDTLPTETSPRAADILDRMSAIGHLDRIPINFSPSLDAMTGGLARGHFWVIGGFTSTGKSAFAANLALDVLSHKRSKVAIVSAEMTQEQYMIRMLSIKSGVPQRDIASRMTIGVDRQAILEDAKSILRNYNLYVYDNLSRMSQIRTEIQRLKNQKGLDVFILDYIQNVSVTGEEVSDARQVAIECQQMAKDLDCTVIAFSQVSNAQAQSDMENSDSDYFSFKGHGAIRDAADLAMMLERDRQRQSNVMRGRIKKHRHGPLGMIKFHFDLDTGKIEEWEEELTDES